MLLGEFGLHARDSGFEEEICPRNCLLENRIISDDLFGWNAFDVAILVADDNRLIIKGLWGNEDVA